MPQSDPWNAENCEVVRRVTGQVKLCPAPPSKSLVFQVDITAQTDRIRSSLFRELGCFTLGLTSRVRCTEVLT